MECVVCKSPLIDGAAHCPRCGARQPFASDDPAPITYAAFISYRHVSRDRDIARKLQKAIETYRMPKGAASRSAYVAQDRRLGRVFQDETELAASPSLPDSIRDALAASGALVVVCSPDTADSYWVSQEIELFASLHGRDRIFCVLADGASADVIPVPLQERMVVSPDGSPAVEHASPLAVDLREGANAKAETLRLIAALACCPYDDLVQRDRARRRKRVAGIAVGAVAIVAVVALLGVAAYSHNRAAQLAQSRELAATSQQLYADGDRYGAIQAALDALPSESDPDRPYDPAARAALETVLNLNYPSGMHWEPAWGITTKNPIGYVEPTLGHHLKSNNPGISAIATNDSSPYFAVSDDAGVITTYNVKTGAELASWELDGDGKVSDGISHARTLDIFLNQVVVSDSNGLGLQTNYDARTGELTAEAAETGGKTEPLFYRDDLVFRLLLHPYEDGFFITAVSLDFDSDWSYSQLFQNIGLGRSNEIHGDISVDNSAALIGYGSKLFRVDFTTDELAQAPLVRSDATAVACADNGTTVVCSVEPLKTVASNYGETRRAYTVQAFDSDLNLIWSHDGTFGGDAMQNRDSDWAVFWPGEPRIGGFTNTGQVLVTAGFDVYLLDLSTGEQTWSHTFDDIVVDARVQSDAYDDFLSIATSDGTVVSKNPSPDALDPEGSGSRLSCGFPIRWAKQYDDSDMVLVLRADTEDQIIAFRIVERTTRDPSSYSLDELISMGHAELVEGGLE